MRIPLKSPVKASSRSAGASVTIREVEITRGRDRSWARQDTVIYLAAYTSKARGDASTDSFELCLDYADARQLVKHLQEELRLQRDYEMRQAAMTEQDNA